MSPLTSRGLKLCPTMKGRLELLETELQQPEREPRTQLEYIETIWDPIFEFLYQSEVFTR